MRKSNLFFSLFFGVFEVFSRFLINFMVSNQQNLFMVFENDAKYPYSFWGLTTLYHAGKDDRLRVTAALLTGECPEKLHPPIELWILPLASYLIKWLNNVKGWFPASSVRDSWISRRKLCSRTCLHAWIFEDDHSRNMQK